MPTQTDLNNIVQNPNQRVGVLEPKASRFFLCHFKLKDYLPSKHLQPESLVSHPVDCCQGHQEGVLPRLEGVWSKTRCALLGSI